VRVDDEDREPSACRPATSARPTVTHKAAKHLSEAAGARPARSSPTRSPARHVDENPRPARRQAQDVLKVEVCRGDREERGLETEIAEQPNCAPANGGS